MSSKLRVSPPLFTPPCPAPPHRPRPANSPHKFTSSTAPLCAHSGGSLGIAGWQDNICQAIPYSYLKPFSFTMAGGSTASYCGWPNTNTDLRLCVSVFGFISVFALFFESPISRRGARSILLFFTSIHFASFVLDASQSIAGGSACTSKFPNTGLNLIGPFFPPPPPFPLARRHLTTPSSPCYSRTCRPGHDHWRPVHHVQHCQLPRPVRPQLYAGGALLPAL